MTEIIYYSLCATAICILMFFTHMKWNVEKCRNLVDPFTFFSGGFFIYIVLGMYAQVGTPYYSGYVLLIFWIASFLGYIAFSFGYIYNTKTYSDIDIAHNIKFRLKSGIIHNWKINKVDAVMLFMLLLFIIIYKETFFNMIFHFGSGNPYLEYSQRSDRTVFTGPIALLQEYFMLFFLGFPVYRMYKTSTVSLFDTILLIILGVYSFASGYRSALISIVTALLCFYNYRYRLIKIKKIIVVAILVFFCLVALAGLRAESSLATMLDLFKLDTLEYLSPNNIGEFSVTVQTTLDYIKAISEGSMEFNFGYTWIVDLLIFIPTFLYPDRPLPWNEQYMLQFYPFAPSGTGNAGLILNDGYMSFGVIGVILELFFVGMVLAKANSFFINKRNNPLCLYIYAILVDYSFFMIRGSFLLGVKNYILEILPFVLILTLFDSKKKDF